MDRRMITELMGIGVRLAAGGCAYLALHFLYLGAFGAIVIGSATIALNSNMELSAQYAGVLIFLVLLFVKDEKQEPDKFYDEVRREGLKRAE